MARTNATLQSRTGKSFSGTILVVALLVASLVLGGVYAREGEGGPLHTVQAVVGMATAPLQTVGSGIAYAEEAAGDAVTNATANADTLTALQQENAQLRAQLAEMTEYQSEAQRLQALLDLHDRYSLEGVTGRVIGKSPDAWDRIVTLDVGSNSGVELGLPAIGSSGVVGQVVEVTPLTCKVRLMADPRSGVSVLLQESRAEGVVKGSIEGLLYLENVDSSVDVQIGDVVVTSGLGGSYFRGLAVGTVANVINAAGTSDRTIVVTPYSEADPLEELSIVTAMNSEGDAAQLSGEDASATDEGDASGSTDAADSEGEE